MPLEEGGVVMPHNEEGLHRGSFPPQEEFNSQEFCKEESHYYCNIIKFGKQTGL